MVYLLFGEKEPEKEARVQQIKKEALRNLPQEFNYESWTSKELTVKKLQESLLRLPTQGCPKRLLLIRNIDKAHPELKEFIIQYSRDQYPHADLILLAAADADEDKIFKEREGICIEKYGVSRKTNAFDLGRALTGKNVKSALKILRELILKGEKPERIVGALRYNIMKDSSSRQSRQENLRLLLKAEIEIKTGKLKPVLSLEKLIVKMCCLPSD